VLSFDSHDNIKRTCVASQTTSPEGTSKNGAKGAPGSDSATESPFCAKGASDGTV
jgi:hypothetical protein